MLRVIALVSASMLATAACNSHPAQGTGGRAGSGGRGSQAEAPPPPPASALEQVQRWAPADTRAAPAEIAAPGVELFVVTDSRAVPEADALPARLVGVTGGAGGKILEGRELVRAVIAGKPDRKALARIALWAAQDDGEVLGAPNSRAQKQARVGPPAVVRNALVFWVWTTDVPRAVEKATLDLATGALALDPLPVPRAVAISNAMTTLAGAGASRHAGAIKVLADACAEPRARQGLLAALANHARVKTRAAVADAAPRCGGAVVDPLINAMEHDRSALVKSRAAAALGRIGDARARPALAKAARGDDANLAWTANHALEKIP